jgi:hypothetical protein
MFYHTEKAIILSRLGISVNYKGLHGKKAVNRAFKDASTFKNMCGDIDEIIDILLDYAEFLSIPVSCQVQGVLLIAKPDMSVKTVKKQWERYIKKSRDKLDQDMKILLYNNALEEEENIIQAHRAYVLERVENENIHILRRKNRKFEKFVVNNDDDVSDRIIEYARHWAVAMQQEMREGYKLHEIAEYTSNFVNYDGITDRMFFLAVVILSHFWKHGKKLREWYNLRTQLAKEGEEANQEGKIVHPTVIKIVA